MPKLVKNKDKGAGARRESDFYPTPHSFVEACIAFALASGYLGSNAGRILDLGTADGRWLTAYAKYGMQPSFLPATELHGLDVRPEAKAEFYAALPEGIYGEYDFTKDIDVDDIEAVEELIKRDGLYNSVIGNPPFRFANEAMVYGFAKAKDTLVMLLPTEFIHSSRRAFMFDDLGMRPNVMVTLPRIDFSGQRKPHTVCSLFLWEKGTNPKYTQTVAFPEGIYLNEDVTRNEDGTKTYTSKWTWDNERGEPHYDIDYFRESHKDMFEAIAPVFNYSHT